MRNYEKLTTFASTISYYEEMIINIGRELAAGGRAVGKALSESLSLAYYDKELIFEAAKESNFDANLFAQADEICNPYMYAMSGNKTELFRIQSQVIRRLAEEGNCLFVGRCADYILRDRTDCLNIFLSCDKEERIHRLEKRSSISAKQAEELIEKTDRQRAAYYNFYTNGVWGAAANYDICINTTSIDIPTTTNLIRNLCELLYSHRA